MFFLRWGTFLLFAATWCQVPLFAQDSSAPSPVSMVDITIVPRVVTGESSKVVWEDPKTLSSFYGKPLTVSLDGVNFLLRVSVTVFPQKANYLLVVQQEVVGHDDGKGTFRTSVQSVACMAGDKLLFYPFGKDDTKKGQELLLEITVQPHDGTH